MSWGLSLGALVLAAVAFAPRAGALEPIEDHRDQWGLTASLGTEWDFAAPLARNVFGETFSPALEVGGTVAVTDTGDELTLRLRLLDSPGVWPMVLAGWRSYFGEDELKSFAAAELFGLTAPFWALGAHGGVGGQYDFSRSFGLFVEIGVGVAVGGVLYRSLDGNLGAQARF